MVTVISRIVHYGFKNFSRNGLLSTATVAIVTLCLVVFLGLLLANAVTGKLIGLLQDKIDIEVYFKSTTPEDQVLAVKSSLEKLPEVKSVAYISQDQALADFKAKHAGSEEITQSLNELQENPLEASLRIQARDPDQYETISSYLSSPEVAQYRDEENPVTYEQKKAAITRLSSIVKSVNRGGFALTLLLSIIAGLVVFNTIRLVIYSNRDEIAIMRAVGASNTFVRGPYLMEGMIIGGIAAIASLLIVALGLALVPLFYNGEFGLGIPDFTVMGYLAGHLLQLIGYQLLFGVGLTVLSSFIAVRRYLRN